MNKKDYRISNIYYILAYAFRIEKLIEKRNNSGAVEEFENMYDLFSYILSTLIPRLIKRGLYKDYSQNKEITTTIKGKINITETIKINVLKDNKVLCEYDEYTENIYLNKIIKTTIFYLLKSKKVKKENKVKLKKTYLYFDNIDILEIKNIKWNSIILNKSNINYKTIINICYMILNGLIISENTGEKQYKEFLDDEKLSVLFERFVREYYIKHYPLLKPGRKNMTWTPDEGYPMIDILPAMQTDINLTYKNKVLIIDTKFYAHILNDSQHGDKQILNRDNWNQLHAYVSNEAYKSQKEVSGMLLYAQTDEEIASDLETSVLSHKMSIKILDMRKDFNSISNRLNEIAESFMIE